jgi:hypothetical protein
MPYLLCPAWHADPTLARTRWHSPRTLGPAKLCADIHQTLRGKAGAVAGSKPRKTRKHARTNSGDSCHDLGSMLHRRGRISFVYRKGRIPTCLAQ